MAEFRRDPIIGQWIIVRTDNSWSPEQFVTEDQTSRHAATCQFCPGKEHMTPPEVDAIRLNGSRPNSSDWKVRVVPNKFPALKIEGDIDERMEGLFDFSNGVGAHEVLIETPYHEKNMADFTVGEVSDVIKGYQRRVVDLTGDQRFKYIIIFKNYGASAGATVEHAHSQIIALPMVPKYVLSELEGAQRYYDEHQRCVFCDMVREGGDNDRKVIENDDFVAFCPFVPRYPFECWIMPKKHNSMFTAIKDNERTSLAGILKETLQRIKICLSNPSYNYYLHISPINYERQESFHWHIEIVPKLVQMTGFEWGTGFYVVRTAPEKAAQYLRKAYEESP